MSLRYKIISQATVFGSKNSSNTITEVALTDTYSDNRKVISGTAGASKLNLDYSYTTGSGESNNSIAFVIEQSPDGTNWYSIANETVSGGTSTLAARTFTNADNTGGATNIKSSIGLDIFYNNIRISTKETGVASVYGTVYAELSLLG